MKIIRSIDAMKRWASKSVRKEGGCGFVPTLGALHKGHRSLIKRARRENSRVVVSVFVNPYQFRKKQYLAYPRDLKVDAAVAKEEGADVLFAPDFRRMYPNGLEGFVAMPDMFKRLRLQKLEWHYKAVLAVVMKLFGIVRPDNAYFGLKDPHQLALIERMVEEFNIPVKVRPCPTVRERDGLAYSSRNALLTPDEREAAAVVYRALKFARNETLANGVGNVQITMSRMKAMINKGGKVAVEHLELVDAKSLLPPGKECREILVYVAARIGGQRLTDNIRFRMNKSA
ncbi:MAG: pantoate--beta-alanine ligase [Nitrospinota bacterium]